MAQPGLNSMAEPAFPAAGWRYFGRRGVSDIFEVYRLAAGGKGLTLDDTLAMERLRRDGSWRHDSNDRALEREMMSGWFDDEDEITAEQARALFEQWSQAGWLGRE